WQPAPPVTTALVEGGSATTPTPDAPTSRTHEVVAGDTLWAIAEQHLGDPNRYTEVYSASTDTVQPDGRQLTDPDLIVPGWVLTLPSAGDRGTSEQSRVHHDEPAEERTRAAEPSATVERDEPAGATEDAESMTPTGAIGGPVPEAAHAADDGLAADTGVGESRDEPGPGGLLRTADGVGAVLAAGLIAVLAARRAVSQRRRRAGQRLSTGATDDRVIEIQMRHVADAPAVEFVDRALRTLAATLHARRRALPALRAARLTRTLLEPYLGTPDQPPEPFVDLGERRVRGLAVGSGAVLPAAAAREHPAPFPCLVTLGHDTEGGLLLVDLEHLRSLAVTGPEALTQALMTAVAAEFATSPWADDIRVTLVGERAW